MRSLKPPAKKLIQGEEKEKREVAEKADRHIRNRVREAEVEIARDAQYPAVAVVNHGFGNVRKDHGVIVRAAEVKGFDGVKKRVLLHIGRQKYSYSCLKKLPQKRDGKAEQNPKEKIRKNSVLARYWKQKFAKYISDASEKQAG